MSRAFSIANRAYIHSAPSAAYDNLNKGTWAMWVYLNSLPGTPNDSFTVLTKDPTNTQSVFIGITNLGFSGQVALNAFFFPPDGNFISTVFSNSVSSLVAVNTWFHLVVTFDEAQCGITEGSHIYINGVSTDGTATFSD